MREWLHRRRLLPRGGTADEIAVGADGDRVRKLALGGQVARNVLVKVQRGLSPQPPRVEAAVGSHEVA